MSKKVRRKHRHLSSRYLAPISSPDGNELDRIGLPATKERMEVATVDVLSNSDDDDPGFDVVTLSKPPDSRPLLVPVLPECSPGGSLLCPTSGSEAEESFLQDYW